MVASIFTNTGDQNYNRSKFPESVRDKKMIKGREESVKCCVYPNIVMVIALLSTADPLVGLKKKRSSTLSVISIPHRVPLFGIRILDKLAAH